MTNIFLPPLAVLAGVTLMSCSSSAPREAQAETRGGFAGPQLQSGRLDLRLLGEWAEEKSGCASDGVRYSFNRDGSYVTDGEFGDWSSKGARITLRHEEGRAAGNYSISKGVLTIRFDGRAATRYVRCAAPVSNDRQPFAAVGVKSPDAGATIEMVTVAGKDESKGEIRIPRVTGIAEDAMRRINKVLDQERAAAVRARNECLGDLSDGETYYDLAAEVRYNADGLLSFRFIGDSYCGGANGTPLYGMHTFDVLTGMEIDVIAATGLETEALRKMAQPFYSTSPECEAIIAEGPESARVMGAFLYRKGLAVVYKIMFGAGERCSSVPAIIPKDVVRSRMRLSGALARAWGGAAAPEHRTDD